MSKPKSPFALYLLTQPKPESGKFESGELKALTELYSQLPGDSRAVFETASALEKERYRKSLTLVKSKILKSPLPIEAKAVDFFQTTLDETLPKKELKRLFKQLSEEEQEKYELLRIANEEELEALKGDLPTRRTPFNLYYLQRKHSTKSTVRNEIRKEWNELSDSEKEVYIEEAFKIELERLAFLHKKEIVLELKPSRQKKAVDLFYLYANLAGKLESQKKRKQKAKEEWMNLPETLKQRFELLAKKEELIFVIKYNEFRQNLKKQLGSTMNAKKLFADHYREELKEESKSKGVTLSAMVIERWTNLSEDQRAEFQRKADIANEEMKKKKKAIRGRVYRPPSRPRPFEKMFLNAKRKEYKKKGLSFSEATKLAVEEFANLTTDERRIWEEKHSVAMKTFERAQKEYEKYHCYNPKFPIDEESALKKKRIRNRSKDLASEETKREDSPKQYHQMLVNSI